MPQNTSVTLNASAYTQITDANVTEITFQNVRGGAVFVVGTVGVSQPAASVVGLRYEPGQGESKRLLADLFPGVSGVNRLWARCADSGSSAEVFVSHA